MHRTILMTLVTCVVFSAIAYAASQAFADEAAFEKDYKDRLSKIDDKKAAASEDHRKLADWAEGQGRLDVAEKELRQSLKLNPDNERAANSLRRVSDAIKKGGETSVDEPAAKPATPAAGGAGGTSSADTRDYVSDEDMQKIKWAELRKGDGGITVDFKRVKYTDSRGKDQTGPALQQFIDSQLGQPRFDRAQFNKLSKTDQLIEIRDTSDHGGVNIYSDIVIKGDPKFMREFRAVWPSINTTCAAANCHGGPRGKGELKLFPRGAGANDKADYTNFLILNLWEKNGRRLIDRDRPEDSLVLQYGLALDKAPAQARHPVVQGWKATFPDKKSGNYVKFQQFIKDLEGIHTPQYGTTYQPSVGRKLSSGGPKAFSGSSEHEEESGGE